MPWWEIVLLIIFSPAILVAMVLGATLAFYALCYVVAGLVLAFIILPLAIVEEAFRK